MLKNHKYQLLSRKHFLKGTIPALFNSTQSVLAYASTLQEIEFFPVLQISGPVCACNLISVLLYISTKNILAVKKEWPRTKKGLGKKEVKSKWAVKACVVLQLLIKIKF